MKIRILADAHHRISSGLSMAYSQGSTPDVPKKIADDLIARGVAEKVGAEPQSAKGE